MSLIGPTNYTPAMPSGTLNGDQDVLNRITNKNNSGKEQLAKTAKEFESLFISKMFSLMDDTVDREGGIFGEEGESKYFDTMKSYMFNEMGRELANNPRTTFGFAKQIYEEMEKFVKD